MNVKKRYWDSVYVYVLLLVPFFCACAAIYWTVCKMIGWYHDLKWSQLILFDVSQIIYVLLAVYFIYRNKKDSSYLQNNMKLIKSFIIVILYIQYNLIMCFFPTSYVWSCTFLFFAIIAFLFDSRIMLGNILAYLVTLVIAHINMTDRFLPVSDENVGDAIVFRIVLYILTSFCIMIVVYFVERFLMKAWESDEENTELLEKQLQYYKDLELLDMEVRKFRHDVKNHFICMESLLNSEKFEELKDYFAEIQGSFNTQKKMFMSGNDVVDAILHYELYHSCKSNVNISVHGSLPSIKNVSSVDLCTIFSNMLSNAIASVNECSDTRESWLEVAFSSGSVYFSITVVNDTANNNVVIKKRKRDRNHGHGISKIRSVLRKYNGNYEINLEGQKVAVSVYLPL